jgi:type I site-specific restriction-modification system R (restriction) subunit
MTTESNGNANTTPQNQNTTNLNPNPHHSTFHIIFFFLKSNPTKNIITHNIIIHDEGSKAVHNLASPEHLLGP